MEKISNPTPPWKGPQKIAFRFVFIFFLLFIAFLDWSVNPILSYLYYYGPLSAVLDSVISWIGQDLFQIPYTLISPYDGEHNDRTYVYLLYFTMVVAAVIGAVIWSFLDRKRQSYNVAYYWLSTIIRYYLAFTMFLFALEKFFKMQFPDLGYYTLTERVGDMSPMHLAWAFFGYSYGYNIFMGMAECAALLLLFRRTTTIGAILTMGALANVIAVNYSYDVHAKMYPTALFIMALFLFLRDALRIAQFFLSGKAVALPAIKAPAFQKKWMKTSKTVLKCLVIACFLIFQVSDYMGYKQSTEERIQAKSEYSGLYDIESFVVNEDTLSHEHPLRWRQLIIGDRLLEAVRFKGDSVAFIRVPVAKKEVIVYGNPTDLSEKMQRVYNEKGMTDDTWMKMDSILKARQKISSFNFEIPDSVTLKLKGKIKNDSVHITAKKRRIDLNDFRLLKRRFHWINEASYFY
ncbi:hypothetical protein [Ulvibacterium sp.]|uniref:hypothetical protein n=1 Tax=Ulvibacterium sp. TaxID=2665914 RepID=UPI00262642BB|nr:hypothetical protein [Ulvibacterium sp.]